MWLIWWALPVISSAIMLFVTMASVYFMPNDAASWEAAMAESSNARKGIEFWPAGRERYRLFKTCAYSVALCLQTIVFFRKAFSSSPRVPPFLPNAVVILELIRLWYAITDAWLLFHSPNVWVNPGLGLYGLSVSFSGAPGNWISSFSMVHIGLGLASGFAWYFLVQCDCVCCHARFLGRLFRGVLLVQYCWYPIYDMKHWSAASRLSNASGEYFLLNAPAVAAMQLISDFGRQKRRAPRKRCDFEVWLDWHQTLFLLLSITRFAWQYFQIQIDWMPFSFGRGFALSWASPAHYPHDGEFQRLHAETHLWQTYVVYGANALGAMFVVCATWCCERDQDVSLEEEADFMESPTLSVHDLAFFKDYLETEIEMEMVDLHPSVKLVCTGA